MTTDEMLHNLLSNDRLEDAAVKHRDDPDALDRLIVISDKCQRGFYFTFKGPDCLIDCSGWNGRSSRCNCDKSIMHWKWYPLAKEFVAEVLPLGSTESDY